MPRLGLRRARRLHGMGTSMLLGLGAPTAGVARPKIRLLYRFPQCPSCPSLFAMSLCAR